MCVRTRFYGAKLMKIIYKNGITRSVTQGLSFYHFFDLNSLKSKKG